MTFNYILEGKTPRMEPDLITWANWMGKAKHERVIAKTDIGEGAQVSTVFLGLDHAFGGGVPILFESMVFGGPKDGHMERYATWEEAEKGHAAMVERCRA